MVNKSLVIQVIIIMALIMMVGLMVTGSKDNKASPPETEAENTGIYEAVPESNTIPDEPAI
jgi:hypothetical protein